MVSRSETLSSGLEHTVRAECPALSPRALPPARVGRRWDDLKRDTTALSLSHEPSFGRLYVRTGDGTPDQLATYVRNATGALSSSALGVGANARAYESVWMGFSPRLLRSTIALVSQAANPDTPQGRAAARSLLGIAGAASLMAIGTNVGIGVAQGKSRQEIEQGIEDTLNPLSGRRFLSVPIEGQYVGVGGQVRAITQFVAKAVANPAGFATTNAMDNPLINFYMGRGSVGVNLVGSVIEGATGEKVNVLPYESIDSLPDAALHIGKSLMPFVLQSQMEAQHASGIDRWVSVAGQFVGLNVNEKSPTDLINEEAKTRHGKPYAELTGQEKDNLETDRADLFALRDRVNAEFGDKDSKDKAAHIQNIEATRLNGERALVDAMNRGDLTDKQFRDSMAQIQHDASILKRDAYGPFDQKTSDPNKLALTGFYALYDAAKVPGTDVIDWDAYDKLAHEYDKTLTPEQRKYVAERSVPKHAEEAQWYFDAGKAINDSGYYDTVDTAFTKLQRALPAPIDSYSKLLLAINAAQTAGDRGTEARLTAIRGRIDSLSDDQKRIMRLRNPALDAALVKTGRVVRGVTA
jgi:hypothetical protein